MQVYRRVLIDKPLVTILGGWSASWCPSSAEVGTETETGGNGDRKRNGRHGCDEDHTESPCGTTCLVKI